MSFANLRDIRINGNPTPRSTYGRKLVEAKNARTGNYEAVEDSDGIYKGVENIHSIYNQGSNDVFSGNTFYGKKDYYGIPFLPGKVPSVWHMGGGLTLRQCLNTVDGGDYAIKYNTITSNLEYFINMQKFCDQILKPVMMIGGRFPMHGGKIKSFYRVSSPTSDQESNAHLVGLAADIGPAPSGGDLLTDSFFKIMNSDIPYDRLIFETKPGGGAWDYIHISMALNGASPKRKVFANLGSGQKNKYYEIHKDRVKDAKALTFKFGMIYKTLNLEKNNIWNRKGEDTTDQDEGGKGKSK